MNIVVPFTGRYLDCSDGRNASAQILEKCNRELCRVLATQGVQEQSLDALPSLAVEFEPRAGLEVRLVIFAEHALIQGVLE